MYGYVGLCRAMQGYVALCGAVCMLCSYVDVGLCSIEVRIVTLHMKLRETTI